MPDYSKKFIALDLETTHLDVKEGRIMEVGAVGAELFFDAKERKVKVAFGKTFDQLVNPEIEPSQTAFALTGISKEDLKQAPLWRDVKKDLGKFLKDKILLGQNIFFDLDYLKNQDLSLKNPYVDTLELAQTFLPLFPMHSLEYLSQELGSSEQAAHRALPDSQNTALVLAGIINEFLSFDRELQTKVKDYLVMSTLPYRDLFLDLPIFSGSGGESLQSKISFSTPTSSPSALGGHGGEILTDWPDKTILNLPLGFGQMQELINTLANAKLSGLVGIAHPAFLEFLPKDQVIPDPDWTLCTKRFERVKTMDKITNPALKILIKITIFRRFRKTLDLSGIKWGGPEREIISAILVDAGVCESHQCDYAMFLGNLGEKVHFMGLHALFKLVQNWRVDLSKSKLLLFDLARIEEEFVESLTQTWNLRKIRRVVNLVYAIDPLNVSRMKLVPKAIEALTNELDLFFGILHLTYLKREGEYPENLLIDELERGTQRFEKLFYPVQKLLGKLSLASDYLKSREKIEEQFQEEIKQLRIRLQNLNLSLGEFFLSPNVEKLYWLKFNSTWVDLYLSSAKVNQKWQELQKKFISVTIVDFELPKISLSYFQNRLAMQDFALLSPSQKRALPELAVQVFLKTPTQNEIFQIIIGLSGKTLVILPNESKLLEYFEFFTKTEKLKKEILSYRYSGNLPLLRAKIEKLKKDAILLLTLNVFLKSFQTLAAFQNLVMIRLPFEAPGLRPDLLINPQKNQFLDHVLPRSIGLLHLVLTRFAANPEKKKTIYLLDSRIFTDYDQFFLQYLRELPNLEISTVQMS